MARSPSSGVPLFYRDAEHIHQPFREYDRAYDCGYRDARLNLTLIGIVLTTARQDGGGDIIVASTRKLCEVPAHMRKRDIAYVDGYVYGLREAFARHGWRITARMIKSSVEHEITAQRGVSAMLIALTWHALNSLRKRLTRSKAPLPPDGGA